MYHSCFPRAGACASTEGSMNNKKQITMNQAKANQLQVMQYQMQREIANVVGINIVTCGQCGQVVLHRVEQEEIECHECGFKSDPCDFPDLNY